MARRACLRARHVTRRFYDRGPNRKDYSDPGFQKLGYIDESCYAYTVREDVRPCFFGLLDLRLFRSINRSHKMANKCNKQKLNGSPKGKVEKLSKKFEDNSELPPDCEFRPIPEQRNLRTRYVERKRGYKGMIQDYTNYTYPGSRLDEYTKMVASRNNKGGK